MKEPLAKDDDPTAPAPQVDGLKQQSAGIPGAPLLRPGMVVEGRLEVQSLIASGGFGSVYKVRHLVMNKTLALKALLPIAASDKTIALRLKRESVAIGKLDHPNIVQCLDFGLIDGTIPYIVMEYVDGQTLSEELKGRAALAVDEALKLFIPICEALAYAHDQGVVHRDIKPGNIMLSRNDADTSHVIPKIVDFGIAKLTFGEEAGGMTLTQTGDIFGTPLYMSPEQCAGSSVDHRSDIYSVGCVLFESLTGAPPITGHSALETMMRHASGEVPSLKQASLGKEFSPALEYVVARMLAKDARQRYQSCYEVATDLRLILQGDTERVRARERSEDSDRTAGPMRRIDKAFLAFVGIICLGIGITAGVVGAPFVVHTKPIPMGNPFKVPNPILSTLDTTSLLGFFHDDADPTVFHFPKKASLGKLRWPMPKKEWKQSEVEAQGTVKIPPGKLVELRASEALMSSPYYWGGFRPNDFNGLTISHLMLLDADHEADDADVAIAAAWQQRNLRNLCLDRIAINHRALVLIGTMPALDGLYLDFVEVVNESDEQQATRLNAAQIAALPNLSRLDTLVISGVSGRLTPILQALGKSHLRRLSIRGSSLNEEDLDAISRLSSLQSLAVSTSLPQDKQLQAFSRLPKLEKLGLGEGFKQLEQASVYKFPKLDELWIVDPKPLEDVQLKNEICRKHMLTGPKFNWNKSVQLQSMFPGFFFDQLR